MKGKAEIMGFLCGLVEALHDLRRDRKSHPLLLDETIRLAIHMTAGKFYAWLKQQKHRRDPVGDLARDAIRDRDWPKRKGAPLSECREYLEDIGACRDAMKAFYRAQKEYQKGVWP